MKRSKYDKNLIGYALAFVSFVLPKIEVNEIILFGSVARGEADEKSDVDLFFDIKDKKVTRKMIEKELDKFYKSKIGEIWNLKGVKNPIKVMVGDLDKWKLKRSIISDGVSLYGRYKEIPGKLKSFVHFNIKPIRDITKRNRIIRKLFGRKEEKYSSDGILKEINGKKLTPLSFVVSLDNSNEIIKFLGKEKVDYRFFEFWTDKQNLYIN